MRPKEVNTEDSKDIQLINNNMVKADDNYYCFDRIFDQ